MALPEHVPMTPRVSPLRLVPDSPDDHPDTVHVTIPADLPIIERTPVKRVAPELPSGTGGDKQARAPRVAIRHQVKPLTFWTVVITVAAQALLTVSIIVNRTDPMVAGAASLGLTICCLLLMCAEIVPAVTERIHQRAKARDLVAEMAARETVSI